MESFNHQLVMVAMGHNEKQSLIDVINCALKVPTIEKIIVVDNYSNDGTFESLKELFADKIIQFKTDSLIGYGAAMNIGLRYAVETLKSKYVLQTNADVLFEQKAVDACLKYIGKNDTTVAVSPLMLDSNNNPQCNIDLSETTYRSILGTCFYFYSTRKNNKSVLEVKELINKKEKSVNGFYVRESFKIIDSKTLKEANYYDEKIKLYMEGPSLAFRFRKINNDFVETLLLDESYIHNHIYKTSTPKSTYKLIKETRIYFIKEYLHKNNFFVFLYKFLFELFKIEMLFIKFLIKMKHLFIKK